MNHTRTGATIWPTANDLASYADRIETTAARADALAADLASYADRILRARALLAEIGTELDR